MLVRYLPNTKKFEKYKKTYFRKHKDRSPGFHFFDTENAGHAKDRFKTNPVTLLHKICHLFKGNLSQIVSTCKKINTDTLELVQ
jgi:hypothetical protein